MTQRVRGATQAPLSLSGGGRLASAVIFCLLVGGWLVYLIGFRQTAIDSADALICTAFTATADTSAYRTLCVVVTMGAEAIALAIFFMSAVILFLRKSREFVAVAHGIMLLAVSAGNSTVTLGLLFDPLTQPLARVIIGLAFWMTASTILIFPDGRFRPRWSWWITVGYALWILSWWLVPALDMIRLGTLNIYPLMALAAMPSIFVSM
ncbi:MAG: hypothetical protein SGJ24_16365 [Chloroflexota bacterium]|nr:hypothetical protein [Chloroflexota bacterium]